MILGLEMFVCSLAHVFLYLDIKALFEHWGCSPRTAFDYEIFHFSFLTSLYRAKMSSQDSIRDRSTLLYVIFAWVMRHSILIPLGLCLSLKNNFVGLYIKRLMSRLSNNVQDCLTMGFPWLDTPFFLPSFPFHHCAIQLHIIKKDKIIDSATQSLWVLASANMKCLE